MKRQISKPERAVLTLGVAQKMAGIGCTPTARTLRAAHDEAGCAMKRAGVTTSGGAAAEARVNRFVDRCCQELSGISGMMGDETGSFWDKVKDVASKAMPFAPFAGPTANLAIPVAKAMLAKQAQDAAKNAARKAATLSQKDEEPQEGDASLVNTITGTEYARPEKGIAYLFGDSVEDTLIYGEGGGSAERAAGRRHHRRRLKIGSHDGFEETCVNGGLPHDVYRAAIVQRAHRMANGMPATARHMLAAQKSVDGDLARASTNIMIPGAQPGRVTR